MTRLFRSLRRGPSGRVYSSWQSSQTRLHHAGNDTLTNERLPGGANREFRPSRAQNILGSQNQGVALAYFFWPPWGSAVPIFRSSTDDPKVQRTAI